jgi:hypothetical protein
MRKCTLSAVTALFILAIGTGWAQKPATPKHQPIPSLPSLNQNILNYGFSEVSQLRVTPSTISFMANSPGSTIAGGSVATLSWNITQGRNGKSWTLRVGANSPSFGSCTTVPVSAISLKCVSASVDGGSQSSAGCTLTNFTALPNTLPGLPLASGNEGSASTHTYTVVLSYQVTDSWRYIANSCPLNVSYTVDVQ